METTSNLREFFRSRNEKLLRRWKKYKRVLLIGFAFFLIVLTATWSTGYLPFTARNELRYTLGIDYLPMSVSCKKTAGESWTDYLFEAEFTMDADDFKKVVSARNYKYSKSGHSYTGPPSTRFAGGESWVWRVMSSSHPTELGAQCEIIANKARSRFFIRYMAD